MPVLITSASLIATVAAHYLWFPRFSLPGSGGDLLFSIGIGVCALGVYILALTGRSFIRERRDHGDDYPTGFVHPLSRVLAFFVVPGVALLLGSWIVFLNTAVILLLFRPRRQTTRGRYFLTPL